MEYPYYHFSGRVGENHLGIELQVSSEIGQGVEADLVNMIKNYVAAIPGIQYPSAIKRSISETSA